MGILPKPPSQAGVELCEPDVLPVYVDDADVPAVAINLVAISLRVLPESEFGQVLLRALTVRLGFLRSVDASETDLMLLPIAVEQSDRVAVSNAHHPTLENVSPDGGAGESK